MSRSSKLAGSLATVAIASLGGPLAAGKAALAEVVKYAQAQYEGNAAAGQAGKHVTEVVTAWADGSREFAPGQIETGLSLATLAVARVGLSNEELAAVGLDPVRAAALVMSKMKVRDRDWGLEDEHAVARRAIEETYRALIGQVQDKHGVLLAAVGAVRGSIDRYTARVEATTRNTELQVGELVEALVAPGSAAEVMSYLQARIKDWDAPVWTQQQQPASALERRLRVRASGPAEAVSGQELSPEEALAGQRMLVVLGGPGSGKSWQARRYARQAAQEALARLADGAGLGEVEIPVLTTWDRWTKTTTGTTSESLVASSFASGLGHSDPGEEGGTAGRLQRTFLDAQTRVLLVVDSLDEAADHAGQTARLHELLGLRAGWRVVVTSRPAAWEATYRGNPNSPGAPRVVEVSDLTYPDDVENFIHAWFADDADSDRGRSLITTIRARTDLARVAVVPLMLTFYCLLAETSDLATEPLPARRRELYRRLVRRLLRAEWTTTPPGPDERADPVACETLLADWAFSAVRGRVTVAGLGQWGDTFTQPPGQVPPAELRVINHVAPKVTEDGEGTITRRFVHRTFLEHFLAEHIATLDTAAATDLLLPHLWFDTDWQVTAPAAIVAHNQTHQGDLLQKVLDRAVHPVPDPARQAAADEVVLLLLAIAEESAPDEWTTEHQGLLHHCRATNAVSSSDRIARSAHWTRSNPQAVAALAAAVALPDASRFAVIGLVGALSGLVTTEADRAQARTAILAVLDAAPWAARGLVGALSGLDPTEADRVLARTAVLAALDADPQNVAGLVGALSGLATTEADRVLARTAILGALPDASRWDVPGLVATLSGLDPTETDRVQAGTAILAVLDATLSASDLSAALSAVPDLVAALSGLDPTEADRAQARTAILAALNANPSHARHLVAGLSCLDPTEPDAARAQARTAILAALPDAAPLDVHLLVAALSGLDPTEADRAQARTAVVAALPDVPTWSVFFLVGALSGLDPTEADRAQARTAILAALPHAPRWTMIGLVGALPDLVTTEADRAQAGTAILAALDANPSAVIGLVGALPGLVTTEADRAQAQAAILAALPAANRVEVPRLVAALPGLAVTEVGRAQARSAVLDAIPLVAPERLADLVTILRSMSSVESWLVWLATTE